MPAVLKTFAAVEAVKLSESPETGPAASETRTYDMSSLEQAAAWLAAMQATAADPKALNPLVALVEEAFGVESRDTDKAVAAQHFRKASSSMSARWRTRAGLREELAAVDDKAAVRACRRRHPLGH